jgi:lipopolysaccharide export LptBFGC system permease protein LptF
MIDFFERVDNFIEANVPMDLMLTYFACKIPHIGVQMLPPDSCYYNV